MSEGISDIINHTFHISHSVPSCNSHQKVTKYVVLTSATYFFGDHTVVVTPVPIPNTVVKHPGPMIVSVLAKVGIANFYFPMPLVGLAKQNPVQDSPRAGFFIVFVESSVMSIGGIIRIS